MRVKFKEIMDLGVWEGFCELKGINPWCIAEGLADDNSSEEITVEEFLSLGIEDYYNDEV